MPQTLAQMVRSKYPGAYDDLSDQQLEASVLSKFPGVYDDLPRTAATPAPKVTGTAYGAYADPKFVQSLASAQGQNFIDAAKGAAAGLASTIYHGGDLIRRGLGMERVITKPEVQRAITPPNSPAGKIGFGGEQMAEFAAPLGAVTRAVSKAPLAARMVAEGAAAAGAAGVQSGGDTGQMALAGGLGVAAPAAGAMVRGGANVARKVVQNVAAGASEGGIGGAIASVARTLAPPVPKTMIVQALKPRATNTGFEAALDRAMPEIKAVAADAGKPIQGLDDLLAATEAAKRKVWAQYERLAGPYRQRGSLVDLTPVADAIEASIPKKLRLENPAAAQRLQELAGVYRKPFPLADAEQLLKETNAELDGFYAKYPAAQRSAVTANPEIAHTVAQGKALRDAIYSTLDGAGEPGAARELKRRYGALSSVEEEVYRRANVAKRQQPESLSEQIGKVRAAADLARGAFKVTRGMMTLSPGTVVEGVADMAAGRAGREVATFLKEQQKADSLIRRAFAAYDGTLPAIPEPVPPKIAGLLERGPIVTEPPADRSFVRGVPAQPAQVDRLALPEGRQPVVTPVAPDGSFVRSVPGEYAQREPLTRNLLPAPPSRVIPLPGAVRPDTSAVGGATAAPIAHEINPLEPVNQGGYRVAQYSGDPEAVPVPVVDREDVRMMLERMRDDLRTLSPERGRLVRDVNDRNRSIYARGGAGSAVGDDVRVISEQNVGNSDILAAVDDLLAGKRPTNRLHTAALDAALGYLERRPGYRGPVVPHASELDALTQAAPAAEDDGFAAFSNAVDDLAAQPEPPAPAAASDAAPPASYEYPARTADTMSDAIAIASPNGRMSKRAQDAASKRLSEKLFGPKGLQREPTPQPKESERLLAQAARLRDLAARGMKPRAYVKKADELERVARDLAARGK